jgi:2-methylisocitrate lyase-like PEP mutase family enzyme
MMTVAGPFRALHAPGQFLCVPTAWDVISARLFEVEAAQAVATSSAALAVESGLPGWTSTHLRRAAKSRTWRALQLLCRLSVMLVALYVATQ